MVVAKFKPSIKSRKKIEEVNKTLQTLEAVKMISMYVLRNQGWGKKRLQRFNDKWNEYAIDISHGHFSTSDILKVLEEETGLTMDELKINSAII